MSQLLLCSIAMQGNQLFDGGSGMFAVTCSSTKIVIFTIRDTILSFPDLMLKLYFMVPKAYLI